MYKSSSDGIATELGDELTLLDPGTVETIALDAPVGRIDVRFLASSPWLSTPPYEAADVTALDGTTLTWLRHGTRWWSTHRDRAGVELELLDDHARIQAWHGTRFGMPRFDAQRAPWMMLALHVAICEAMRAHGF